MHFPVGQCCLLACVCVAIFAHVRACVVFPYVFRCHAETCFSLTLVFLVYAVKEVTVGKGDGVIVKHVACYGAAFAYCNAHEVHESLVTLSQPYNKVAVNAAVMGYTVSFEVNVFAACGELQSPAFVGV